MSDAPAPPVPRPVSLVTIFAILFCFALFLIVTLYIRGPHQPPPPQNEAAQNLDADNQWSATPESRLAYLDELRAKQAKQAASYAWVDRKAGVVQIPIDRAMELVVGDINAKNAKK